MPDSACAQGLGQRLAHRLCLAALVAANNRACYPVRAIHDRTVKVLELAVAVDSQLFPSEFVEQYLEGREAATTDAVRMTLGRYVTLLEQLHDVRISYDAAGVRQFLLQMKDAILNQPDRLKLAVEELSRQLQVTKNQEAGDPGRCDRPAAGTLAGKPGDNSRPACLVLTYKSATG